MQIRAATADDWPEIWPFFRQIVQAAETYCIDPHLSSEDGRRLWFPGPVSQAFVAVEDGRVVGTARVYPNQGGPGSHVASASFMVDPAWARGGVGRALGGYVLDWARDAGFCAMQFNAVVETNSGAVALWRSLGFEVLATVPEAFVHPTLGSVGVHIMYRRL